MSGTAGGVLVQTLIAITGMRFHDLLHTHTQQDVELDKLYMDVCIYNCRIMGPAHVENVVDLACRTAMTRRGVAHVTMPVDMQSEPVKKDVRSKRNVKDHVSMAWASSALDQPVRALMVRKDDLQTDRQVFA